MSRDGAEPLKLVVAEASSDGQLQSVVAGVRWLEDQAQAIDRPLQGVAAGSEGRQ
jgi:hypothetical protein